MQARSIDIEGLLDRPVTFRVPAYQRRYIAAEEEWQSLWKDLVGSTQADGARTFLGSIILAPMPAQSDTTPVWAIVDGQQRLVTIYLALTVLRDEASRSGVHTVAERAERLLHNQFERATPKFEALRADRDTMDVLVRSGSGEAVEAQYRYLPVSTWPAPVRSYLFFARQVTSLVGDNGRRTEVLEALLLALSKIQFVEVVPTEEDDLIAIFERLSRRPSSVRGEVPKQRGP